MTLAERAADPAARLQHALDCAYRYLARCDRSVAQVRRHLETKRVDPAAIDVALAELAEQGYLDDARYAQRFAQDRRALDGWGTDRIARRLASVGVTDEHVAAALDARDGAGELQAAIGLLQRRFTAPLADERERERALGYLARKGHPLERAYDAIRAFDRSGAG